MGETGFRDSMSQVAVARAIIRDFASQLGAMAVILSYVIGTISDTPEYCSDSEPVFDRDRFPYWRSHTSASPMNPPG